MMNHSDKKWLIVIAVVLVGIFAVTLYGVTQNTEGEKIGNSISDIIGSAGDGAKELKEEIEDEIDDNTDLR